MRDSGDAAEVVADLAGAEDEPELRRLMREIYMPGQVAVAFEREPDFFQAAAIEGDRTEIIVARAEGRLVGMGGHASRTCFVQGEPTPVGYVSMLRVEPEWRRSRATRAGFELLSRVIAGSGNGWCVSTVIADNERARRALEREGGWMPLRFTPRELICTQVCPTWRRREASAGVEIRPATDAELDGVAACLRRCYQRRQFAPVWTAEALRDPARTRGLTAADFLVALDGGEVIGAVALWDQGAFKQSVVRGYGAALRYTRPVANLLAPALNVPRLPPPGAAFRHAYLSHLAARDDDPGLTLALVCAGYARAREAGLDYVTVGLSERDPRLALIQRRLGGTPYRSLLYVVTVGDPGDALERLDDRPAHLEVAVL